MRSQRRLLWRYRPVLAILLILCATIVLVGPTHAVSGLVGRSLNLLLALDAPKAAQSDSQPTSNRPDTASSVRNEPSYESQAAAFDAAIDTIPSIGVGAIQSVTVDAVGSIGYVTSWAQSAVNKAPAIPTGKRSDTRTRTGVSGGAFGSAGAPSAGSGNRSGRSAQASPPVDSSELGPQAIVASIESGEVVAIAGAPGSGKSTYGGLLTLEDLDRLPAKVLNSDGGDYEFVSPLFSTTGESLISESSQWTLPGGGSGTPLTPFDVPMQGDSAETLGVYALVALVEDSAVLYSGSTATSSSGLQVDSEAINAVPEPSSLALLAFGLYAAARRHYQRYRMS